MRRHALGDVDVLVPVRIDTDDRLENLEMVLRTFAEVYDGARVWVLEHDAEPRARERAAEHGAEYHFVESTGCFHKSRVLNLAVALADRRFVLVYDCDVLCPPDAILEARRRVAGGEAEFVYPYNGLLLQVSRALVRGAGCAADVLASLPAAVAERTAPLPAGVEYLYGSPEEPSTGAALLADRRALLLAGGYNENIVSYGCEDTELATRLRKLERRVAWVEGHNAYHVAHRRGADSRYNNFHSANLAEWRKVEAMDRDTLAAYVRNGFRSLVLDSRATLVVTDDPGEFSMRVEHAPKIRLDDVAFVLPLGAAPTGLRNLVESFLDRLDASYDGYELALVELGAYEWQRSGHRDHVQYVHAGAQPPGDGAWLRDAVAHSARPIVCVCTPFTDVSPESLCAAIDAVREGAPTAAAPSCMPDGLPADRAPKLAALLARSLPVRGDALVFRREPSCADRFGSAPDRGVPYASAVGEGRGEAGVSSAPFDLTGLRRELDDAASERPRGADSRR